MGSRCSPWCAGRRAFELIVGMSEDAQFGPVLLFGEGGTGVEAIADTAMALPPLDPALAAGADRRDPNRQACCAGIAGGPGPMSMRSSIR